MVKENDCVIIHGEAGMGKTSTAKRLKGEWCKGKVFNNHNIIYYDSKKINKQLLIQSNAAALVFSELGDHLKKKRRTIDDLSIYNCVKTIINDQNERISYLKFRVMQLLYISVSREII